MSARNRRIILEMAYNLPGIWEEWRVDHFDPEDIARMQHELSASVHHLLDLFGQSGDIGSWYSTAYYPNPEDMIAHEDEIVYWQALVADEVPENDRDCTYGRLAFNAYRKVIEHMLASRELSRMKHAAEIATGLLSIGIEASDKTEAYAEISLEEVRDFAPGFLDRLVREQSLHILPSTLEYLREQVATPAWPKSKFELNQFLETLDSWRDEQQRKENYQWQRYGR